MDQKLKVLMFGWEFPPYNSGGLGTACLGLTRALNNLDVEIIFVLPKKLNLSSPFVKLIFADDLITYQVDSPLTPYLTSDEYSKEIDDLKGIYGKSLMNEVLRYGKAARKIAKTEKFDIIHAHDWLSFIAGIEAKKVSGKPLIVHVHSTELDRTGGNNINQAVYQLEKKGMQEADQIIAVSGFTKDMIVKHYGIDPCKIQVVHNGIEINDYQGSSNGQNVLALKEAGYKIVLFVGRITLQKGPDYFLKVAKKVLEVDPNVYFIIAGSGDMEYQMIREAVELNISDKVLFAGFLRGEELNNIYQAADLFVMPSVSEPFGITALESVVNGTPVIVSKQSGVSETLTHALKVDFWDIDEMTNKILGVLHSDSLQQTLKSNAWEEVKKITWSRAAERVKGLYQKFTGRFR